MTNYIGIDEFLELRRSVSVLDVRSPQEYGQGHVPGAVNLPLFSNAERSLVGKTYKEKGRDKAILYGLDFAGKKLSIYVTNALRTAPQKRVLMHCWRGGMRSEAMGWLLSFSGFDISLLNGGYKAYREFIRNQWDSPANIIALSGKTGAGKTEILEHLRQMGQQVVDLEKLACHKGSAFGSLGQPPQPTNEQFENDLADKWIGLDWSRVTWIEDESRSIGCVSIPGNLKESMQNCTVVCLDMPVELRVGRLVRDYSSFPENLLAASVEKIKKKLGGQHATAAVKAIENKDFSLAARIILKYYDKAYSYDLKKREKQKVLTINTDTADAGTNARRIIEYCGKKGLL